MADSPSNGERLVRGACPHDCPDTCAMHITVDASGRATRVTGDPDHPVTQGWLCGKVSNYLDRVYAEDRILAPLLRDGAKGSASFRRASWDEALEAVATGLRGAIDRHGGESILPYSYLGSMGYLQRDSISARVMNALGASDLVRTICANAGMEGAMLTSGASPEVDPERWPEARLLLVWGWNPQSTAPHLWRKLLEARRNGANLVVIDPFCSRTARVADLHIRPLPGTDGALALGMMRAIVDEGLADEDWCREYCDGYDELVERLARDPVERWAAECDVDEQQIRELAREYADTHPSLLRLGVGAQHHAGAEIAYRTIACLPALVGAWRHVGGGFSYLPTAITGAIGSDHLRREELRSGPVRSINMSQLGDTLTDSGLEPPVAALVVWNSNPAQVAPDQTKVLEGLRREDLFTIVCEQFMTDTAAHADVVLPATTQLEQLDASFSWGHHYVTYNEPAIAPLGEAKPNTEIFRRIARAMGLDDPCFFETDEQMLESVFEGDPAGFSLDELRERGWAKVDLGQGATPHAEGNFYTETGKLGLLAEWMELEGVDTLPYYEPPAEVADAELAKRFPLALLTPKTHLFLNSTFPNQKRQHSRQPEPYLVINPDDAAARSVEDGALVRAFNERGEFVVRAQVSEDARAGVVVAPMGWWSRDYPSGTGGQATTSQRLTAIAAAPTFNDNRVEVAPAK